MGGRGANKATGGLRLGVFLCVLWTQASAVAYTQTLDSEHPGLYLDLRGKMSVSGTTPLAVDGLPPGEFVIRGKGLGFASSLGRVSRQADGSLNSRRYMRRYEILLPPGATQFGRGEIPRGLTFLAAGVTSGIEIVIKELDRQYALDDVDKYVAKYSLAVERDEAVQARQGALAAAQEAEDAEDLRNLWIGYLVAVWGGSAAESWLFTPVPKLHRGKEDGNVYMVEVPEPSKGHAALLSALVPGAGQRHTGRGTSGTAFAIAVYGLAAGTIFAQGEYLEARRDQRILQREYYEADTESEVSALADQLGRAAKDTQDLDQLRWILAGATVAAHLWNIFDATVFPSRLASPTGGDLSFTPTPDGFHAALTWRIP